MAILEHLARVWESINAYSIRAITQIWSHVAGIEPWATPKVLGHLALSAPCPG